MNDDADTAKDATDDDALDPDELGPDDEHVRPLGDGRFLVRADPDPESSPNSDGASLGTDAPPDGARGTDTARAPPGEATAETGLCDLDGAYALVALARTEGESGSFSVASDDVTEPFEALVRWYVGRVASDVSPEEALAVLLANSDLDLDVSSRSE